ncbi:cytidylate kinase [Thermosulfidibacter takaii ABI70S6]|uniref:Cytidylate kinase n=1 Tax=Thermosulfidibacter takaii (strain DSM 17441 / JCM 13301 / NBRC 103674 / ABI70S6) TaxID=1298851 RepID=A0A0S3QTL5_THET7|nr:(d)CMP kinase [Thermosulfidibacter takaii]BAT71653.1 cytidylate kinase [Thermosulfidibacter takaii ABI70S6]
MIIAIDGPAGSGKSTVSKLVAQKLGATYLDTGAIYRALGYLALKKGVSLDDEDSLEKLARAMKLEMYTTEEGQKVLLEGEDISKRIRTEEIGMAASKVSRHPKVRAALLDLQRSFAQKGSVVAEGRDTGTVVFPNADIKIFLTASPEVRARRRYLELKEKGIKADYDDILESVLQRDKQDSSRSVAPLRPAEDAVIIDTSDLSIEEVVNSILKLVDEWKEKHTSC